ncbi:unnamed protein product [Staurois parvus]|uniref:Uncharacterized protein n=1 Tax=Staurois parvus TaxID=386267 RepID=A0ABN9ASV6_9NEOB|nr:unnamed protein product [Staurois parvus]
MGDTERQLRWALMDTDRWDCWGYTDHQCPAALFFSVSVTALGERNANNRHFPVSM